MAKPPVGLIACPECEFPDAQVKEDKNGHAYRFCPECESQYFTRGGTKDERLRARMRPIAAAPPPRSGTDTGTGTGTDPVPPASQSAVPDRPAAQPVPDPPARPPAFRTALEKAKWEEEQRSKGRVL